MDAPEGTRKFLWQIVQTISMIMLWMMIHLSAGIYFGLAFFERAPGWKNYAYYLFFLASLYFLIKYLRRKWNL
jgi:hypothetical protein